MKVLVACEYSGVVRDAFIRQGHDAMSCDLLPSESGFGPHYQGNVLDILDRGWDLMVAHPPCDHLAVSGSRYFAKKRELGLQQAGVDFFMRIAAADIKKVAIENPVGIMSSIWRKPDQIIQPYLFGHDASKKTCLWLKNLPLLKSTQYVKPRRVCKSCGRVSASDEGCSHCGALAESLLPRWENQTDSGQNKLPPSKDRAKNRSLTYLGIAEAMANQWSGN